MRIAAHVLVAYLGILLLSATWRFTPLDTLMPDAIVLAATYLGLTARPGIAASTLGAVIVGYLGDLLIGTPRGLSAFAAGVVCITGHLVHRRLLVRGRALTFLFSFVSVCLAGVVVLAVRAYLGLPSGSMAYDLQRLAGSAFLTAVLAPPYFFLCRHLDARFARTHRERDAALEGFIP